MLVAATQKIGKVSMTTAAPLNSERVAEMLSAPMSGEVHESVVSTYCGLGAVPAAPMYNDTLYITEAAATSVRFVGLVV
jgi:hypothetical protein